ncbi:hypothetical protein VQL36_14790 [Chengkuizengella sp. SCS-71B]|uniref:hypothetical protein n=1 Tax=Chengkuizengella sp. SCS-71B TaxID=3115290 RepID=UPI0032C23AA3
MNGHKPEMQLTIDHLVIVQEEIDKIVTGKKTTVRRHGKYAEVGEILNIRRSKLSNQKCISTS